MVERGGLEYIDVCGTDSKEVLADTRVRPLCVHTRMCHRGCVRECLCWCCVQGSMNGAPCELGGVDNEPTHSLTHSAIHTHYNIHTALHSHT